MVLFLMGHFHKFYIKDIFDDLSQLFPIPLLLSTRLYHGTLLFAVVLIYQILYLLLIYQITFFCMSCTYNSNNLTMHE